jgi:Tol biopolymer transport system component
MGSNRNPCATRGARLALLGALAITSTTVAAPARADIITVEVPGCVIPAIDVLGWWKGQDNLAARIGPDLVGDPGFVNGFFGRAFSFNGTTTTATVAPLGPVSTGVTVEMYIRPIRTGSTMTLASRWDFPGIDDAARSYRLAIDAQDNLVWETDETSTRRPEALIVPATSLFDGLIHHVAATWDTSQFALYIDGVLVGSRASQGGLLNPASSVPFRLGMSSGLGGGSRYQGMIDEPSILRRALTATEVDKLYNAGPNSKCVFVTADGLVGPTLQFPGDVGGVDPVISPDGRYVLFRTRSTNLIPVVNDPIDQDPGDDLDAFDSYRDDLILIDRQGTAHPGDDTLELISVDSAELGGSLDSAWAAMTPTASHVAFSSISNDLVAGDTLAGRDVFVRNRLNGTTERVSVRSNGSQPQFTATGLNNDNRDPALSDNGQVIAFASTNRDLAPEANPVPGDTWQTYDIYVRDVTDPNPANHLTERLTVGLGGLKADGSSSGPLVSGDGRYVWFSSAATNLVAGDTNGRVDLFRFDRQTDTVARLNLTPSGTDLDGDTELADVTPDGRWVLFSSAATTHTPGDANGRWDVFVHDTVANATTRVSLAGLVATNGDSFAGSISDDGRYVIFTSGATNLVPDDTNARADVFIADRTEQSVQRISLGAASAQRPGVSGAPAATAGATLVVYTYQAIGSGIFEIWESELSLEA